MKVEFYKHNIEQEDIDRVSQVLREPFLTTGKWVEEFEEKFAKYVGAKYAVGVSSCTAALHLSLLALELDGTEIITTPLTFIATSNAILYAGGKVKFVDVDAETGNINLNLAEKQIGNTSAVIPVFLYGQPCPSHQIKKLKGEGIKVIVDAAHALETKIDFKSIDTACYSFYPTKSITCIPEGTPIVIKNHNKSRGQRNTRNIETLKVGDTVLTYNTSTGEKEESSITRVFSHSANNLLKLKFSNYNELEITPNHPIYVVNKGWTPASEVKVGDQVLQYLYKGLGLRCKGKFEKGKKYEEFMSPEEVQRLKNIQSITSKRSHANPNSRHHGKFTPEVRIKMSKNIKKAWKDPIKGKNMRDGLAKRELSLARPNTSIAARKFWDSPESKPLREQFRQQCQEHSKKLWAAEDSPFKTPRWKEKQTISHKKFWKNIEPAAAEEIMRRMMNGLKKKPNKQEIRVGQIIDEVCPNEFRFNGCFELGICINCMIPDFVNVNGKKKVIEFFGSGWHKLRNDYDEKMSRYRKAGFDCLIIWGNELTKKNDAALRQKILNFVYNPRTVIVTVESIETIEESRQVYNIETEKNHNYFAYGILVHNCGEGGAVATNSKHIADKIRMLRLHGMTKSAWGRYDKKYKHWDMEQLGWKYNMTNIQAAMLLGQLDRVDNYCQKRKEIATIYEKELAGIVEYPFATEASARLMFTIWVKNRDEVLIKLQEKGIGVAVNFRPVHLLKYYRSVLCFQKGDFPVAESIGSRTISLPLYPKLTESEIAYVIESVKEVTMI
jgi:dTDP-4-amino-4,6-dideoxygalactose transaminase